MNEQLKKRPFQETIIHSFAQFQGRTAVEHNGARHGFGDLEDRSRAMCAALLRRKPAAGTYVGVYMRDRYDFICAIVAVLLARCVFVPLDPNLPQTRITGMLAQTGIRRILTIGGHTEELIALGAGAGDGFDIVSAGEKEELPLPEYHREDPVYIYFTSGSSGSPKAILGRNKSLGHFIHWEIDTFCDGTAPRVSQLVAPSFDAILRDIFVPLCSGGTICIPPEKQSDAAAEPLYRWIDRNRVNLVHCVPSVFEGINSPDLSGDEFRHLTHVLLSGERIHPEKLKPWYRYFGRRITLVNLYGPTETTMTKTFHIIRPEDLDRQRIPIGTPMPGSRLVLFDKDMNICDRGSVGEIYIRTPFRTHGYVNAPELNTQSFIPNPITGDPDDLLYKTGDLGCELPDGAFDLLGRIDRQVKIRGVRVELEEVELALFQHPDVQEAIVVDAEHPSGERHLCAYLVVNRPPRQPEIADFLKGRLPEAMIPAFFKIIDTIPRTASGKIDRNQLPSPFDFDDQNLVAPSDPVERRLAFIWAGILNIPQDRIGMNTDFFAVGGHSLNAVTLAAHIHREFDVNIPLSEIFRLQQAGAMASFIKVAQKEAFVAVKPAERREYYPLSAAQKRFYIQWQLETGSTSYNMPVFLEAREDFSPERVTDILRQLIGRHESLRTSFPTIAGETVQRVHDAIALDLEYLELPETTAPEDQQAAITRFVRPFDLEQPPLIRAGLIAKGPRHYVLMVDIHHIVSDAISNGILVEDFAALYFNEPLSPMPLQYRDFSFWQKNFRRLDAGKKTDGYWAARFTGDVPVLQLPCDFPRPRRQNFDGDSVELELDRELSGALLESAASFHVTPYILFLAVCTILLAKYSGQTDIIVGTPVGGRRHNDLQRIIGLFTNVLLMRNFPEPDKTFAAFLDEVRLNAVAAFENQDYSLEELMEQIDFKRDPGRNPLYDVVFMMRDDNQSALKKNSMHISQLSYRRETSKRDLRFEARVAESGVVILQLTYATALFKRETAMAMLENFAAICRQITAQPAIPLKDIQASHRLVKAAARRQGDDEGDFGFDLD